MAWYEISALFFFVGSAVTALVFALVWDVRRMKAIIHKIKKQQQFYEIASEWFYYHMGDKP